MSFTEEAPAQNQFKVLLFIHHDDWHSDCIPVAVEAFQDMAQKNQFAFRWTQRPNELPTLLPQCDVVIFLNTNTDFMDSSQVEALQEFIHKGGGFVGIHGASASIKRNEWYDKLVGGVFVDHPKLQAGVVHNVGDFPATWHLPQKWLWSDEWYNFSHIDVSKLNVILTVDESTYDYTLGYDEIPLKGMGKDHPVAWSHHFEGGSVFYTSLGHKPEVYKDENFLKHIFGGIYWASKKVKNIESK
ncbi:ThuA domain-containing protein [Sediminitomix flava]|uniref:ThuA-like domain-containing protein n=1 Tax=Sediminitomix flava TaxID=379075 RepID=A0A315Z9F1_SEDFL|nr:ThuA domain-containing protein [Sediminitomix flava]PWJ41902.1 hypothetical protein BC781_103152 [Sediminitomix flava]